MKKYYEVGEVFINNESVLNNGDVIRVVESNARFPCRNCQFNELDDCTTNLVCSAGDRYDGKNIIYAKIDELEEGEEFKEENYAK
jgi:hypothetical protein